MLLDVFSGAIILFVGVLTGYAICNVNYKRRTAEAAPAPRINIEK